MSESLRAFFALPVPPAERAGLVELQRRLRQRLPSTTVRWTAEDMLHLTLKFLGGVRQRDVGAFAELVDRHAARLARGRYPVTAVTAFPGPRRARVLAVRLLDSEGRLEALARSLEQGAEALGVPAEQRAFRPHVTLGRSKLPIDVAALLATETELPPIAFERLVLYRSDPGIRGSTYRALCGAELPDESDA